jgi:hypothetical protein
MIARALLLILAGLLTCGAAENLPPGPDDAPEKQRIRDKLDELTKGRKPDAALKAIADWKHRTPESPDPYIVAANFHLSLATQPKGVNIQGTKPGAGPLPEGNYDAKLDGDRISIVDPKTGKEVGTIGDGPVGQKPDPKQAREHLLAGAAELEEALRKFPDRLDIMLGRASILATAREWNPLTTQLDAALARAARDPQNLRWLGDKPPFRPAPDLVRSAVQENVNHAIDEQAAEGDARAKALSELALKYFPDAVVFLANLGSLHAFAGEWKEAVPYYERAVKLAPDDSLVWGNLARVRMKLGEPKAAREAAKKVIELNNDAEGVKAMKSLLRDLDSPDPADGTKRRPK